MNEITKFKGFYSFLSNFETCFVTYEGMKFRTDSVLHKKCIADGDYQQTKSMCNYPLVLDMGINA